jgi:hypothetical protein
MSWWIVFQAQAEAGNRAGQTEHCLQWQDTEPECMWQSSLSLLPFCMLPPKSSFPSLGRASDTFLVSKASGNKAVANLLLSWLSGHLFIIIYLFSIDSVHPN